MDSTEIEATIHVQEYRGSIECMHCFNWATMKGYVPNDDDKWIFFICEECNALNKVLNPDAI